VSATDSTWTTSGPSDTSLESDAVHGQLAALVIDDDPAPQSVYRREDWPTWDDIDHDGCDARNQALIAQSTTPAVVAGGCTVTGGTWTSPYDGVTTTDPGALDADHMVPLAEVNRSGGSTWDRAERLAYANDQGVLVMVTAHANRSKGDRSPDQWRPTLESDWCAYATQWIGLKLKWHLTATTPERDALGQMLDRCT